MSEANQIPEDEAVYVISVAPNYLAFIHKLCGSTTD